MLRMEPRRTQSNKSQICQLLNFFYLNTSYALFTHCSTTCWILILIAHVLSYKFRIWHGNSGTSSVWYFAQVSAWTPCCLHSWWTKNMVDFGWIIDITLDGGCVSSLCSSRSDIRAFFLSNPKRIKRSVYSVFRANDVAFSSWAPLHALWATISKSVESVGTWFRSLTYGSGHVRTHFFHRLFTILPYSVITQSMRWGILPIRTHSWASP